MSIIFLTFQKVHSIALDIWNFEQIGTILTWNKKNSKKIFLVGLRAMAVQVIGRFGGRKVNGLFNEGSDRGTVSLVICRGPFYLPKGTF